MTTWRSVSVLVAAYNEAPNLESAVNDLLAVLNDVSDYEVIIVDDGSVDGTGDIADRLASEHPHVRAIHHPTNKGVAEVYFTGLQAATKEYFTWIGGDGEIAQESIRAILEAIGTADLVIPYHATPEARAWYRRVITWVATTQINLLFGWPLQYYQGPTVYPRKLGLQVPVENRGFFFASEMLIRTLTGGYSWVEVGLRHQERQHGRSSAVKPINIVKAQLSVMKLWWSIRVVRTSRVVYDLTESEATA